MRRIAGVALGLALANACGSDDGGTADNTGGQAGSGGSSGTAGSAGAAGSANDAGWGDSGCTAASCTAPGHACVAGACVEDCRVPGANPCAAGTECSVGDASAGKCLTPGSACLVTSPPESCGSVVCGPGTRCDGEGGCYAALPCKSTQCSAGACFGVDCPCTRPAPTCTPAPLGTPGDPGTLNDFVFSRCGTLSSCDGGIFDLDFDQSCNAWGVTMISGTDYLRKITPAGAISEHAGVTNLNMGEVAAIQGASGVFGGGLSDVALSYICCSTCGCILTQSGPQGVAALEAGQLPMKIPTTTYTSGAGPFGAAALDTGPYGLSWGLDRVLYVGNIAQNGDYHALDLTAQSSQLVTTFSKRVLASAPFDKIQMLVGLEGGEVLLTPVLGKTGTPQPLITLSTHMTSLVRDPWSGRVYAELSDQSIVSFAADGTGLTTFQTAPALGRVTIAPDGFLYHLTVGFPTPAEIVRWELPKTL